MVPRNEVQSINDNPYVVIYIDSLVLCEMVVRPRIDVFIFRVYPINIEIIAF